VVEVGQDDELVGRLRAAGCVFAEDEARLLLDAAGDGAELEAMVARRVAGEPLEQVLGWASFDGLRIRVTPGVFVPRRRSELLVAAAVRTLDERRDPVVVDLCCGSGALGAAIAARRPDAVVHAADVDPDAVACARLNLPADRVHHGDLFGALPPELRGGVDVVVVNAPYVPTDEIAFMPPEARDHEHLVALDGGADGLDLHRRIAADVAAWLVPGGSIAIETSRGQAATTAGALRGAGLAPHVLRDEELDATVVVATCHGGGAHAART